MIHGILQHTNSVISCRTINYHQTCKKCSSVTQAVKKISRWITGKYHQNHHTEQSWDLHFLCFLLIEANNVAGIIYGVRGKMGWCVVWYTVLWATECRINKPVVLPSMVAASMTFPIASGLLNTWQCPGIPQPIQSYIKFRCMCRKKSRLNSDFT